MQGEVVNRKQWSNTEISHISYNIYVPPWQVVIGVNYYKLSKPLFPVL